MPSDDAASCFVTIAATAISTRAEPTFVNIHPIRTYRNCATTWSDSRPQEPSIGTSYGSGRAKPPRECYNEDMAAWAQAKSI